MVERNAEQTAGAAAEGDATFEVINTGGGCLAWYHKDASERPNHYALVTTADGMHKPDQPETDELLIGIYEDTSGDALRVLEVCGRAALNDWYLQHVGYRPDDDAGAPIQIEDLIHQVVSMFLLHAVPE